MSDLEKCPCGWKLPVAIDLVLTVDESPEVEVSYGCPHCGRRFKSTKAKVIALDGAKAGEA